MGQILEETEAKPLVPSTEGTLEIPFKKENSKTEEKPTEKEEPIIVNNSNLIDLKNACDDYIQKFFVSKANFRQNNTHTDVKLVLGYLACAFALSGGYYGHITPFNEAKEVTFICIIAYSDIYNIIFEYVEKEKQDSSIKLKDSKYTISKSFGNWFDVKGVMDIEKFERDLSEGLEIVKTGNKPHEQ
ncbi:12133_t:CDS:2 [Rhizophagus irregularis]|nr:12133_t:CDS:2 [Rhizophagus irregularis]